MGRIQKTGLISSIIFALYIILLDINYIFIFISPNAWTTPAKYAANYSIVELLPEIYGFFLYPVLLCVVYAVLHLSGRKDTLAAHLADFTSKVSAAVIMIVYFIQFAIVFPAIQSGTADAVTLWIFGNPASIAWGLNYFGWFLGAAAVVLIGTMLRDTFAKVISIAYGACIAVAFFGYCTKLSFLEPTTGLAWFLLMPAFFIRLCILFSKTQRTGAMI